MVALPLRIETGGVQPLLRAGVREGLHGTCVPRGPKRRIHLLPLLSSGIRRAGTTVSDEAIFRNCGVLLNFAESLFCPLAFFNLVQSFDRFSTDAIFIQEL